MEDWENLKEDYNRLISREKEGEYVKMLYEYVE
jgi:hypothetical protein